KSSICSFLLCCFILKHFNVQDIYDSLWTDNEDMAKQTLSVPFLQHMQSGDLQADDYVSFMLQDIYYLLNVTDMLKQMAQKVKKPEDLRFFMENRYQSYKKFADLMLKQFNLNALPDIKPIPAMEKYLADYKTIMVKEKPIFFAVSLLPCSRLWIWIANQLQETYCNAYFIWKKNNMHGNPEKHYRDLLNKYLTTPSQIKRANEIFRQQMQNEKNFFYASLQE
uniref:Thiaminase-2/PQQC domain-containing protein n=1 Tax=Cyprinodon variegatus TaxID=28743 RepID=A0A3Q2FV17_CYPVA